MRWWLLLLIPLFLLQGSCGRNESKKIFVVARDPEWHPIRLMGKETSFLGFTDDLVAAIGAREGVKVEFLSVPTDNLLSKLRRKKCDAVITSQLPRNWEDNFVLSDPIYRVGPVLIVRANSDVESILEMENRSVGIEISSAVAFDIEETPSLRITPYRNILIALESLTNGQIDGVVMEAIPAYIYVNSFYRGKIKVVTSPLNQEAVHMVALASPSGARFVETFNQGLESLKENGGFDSLLLKWGLQNPEK